jgi:flavin reductase (DIM6/NTAB) family NADH-FMN oxidoreductase RutF
LRVFTVARGRLAGAPLVEECPLNLEYKVIHRLDLGSHFLVVGEIVETHVSRDCLDKSGKEVLPAEIDPLIYTPSSHQYQRLGEVVGKAFHDGRQL